MPRAVVTIIMIIVPVSSFITHTTITVINVSITLISTTVFVVACAAEPLGWFGVLQGSRNPNLKVRSYFALWRSNGYCVPFSSGCGVKFHVWKTWIEPCGFKKLACLLFGWFWREMGLGFSFDVSG